MESVLATKSRDICSFRNRLALINFGFDSPSFAGCFFYRVKNPTGVSKKHPLESIEQIEFVTGYRM